MYLKDSKMHLEAIEYAKNIAPDKPEIFEEFYYFLRLYHLDPTLVKISLPGHRGPGEKGILVYFLYPYDVSWYELEEIPDDAILEGYMIEIELHVPMSQREAAKYCQVNSRTIQRWEKYGLKSIKFGREKIYSEEDLIFFMRQSGHVRGMKQCGVGGYRIR